VRAALPGSATLSTLQVRLIVALTAAAALVQTLGASFNYILDDMLRGLGSSASQSDIARQMPTVGALLVTFVAGALGQRLGSRRVILACCGLYALGSCFVARRTLDAHGHDRSAAGQHRQGRAAGGGTGVSQCVGTKTSDGRATAFAAFSAAIPFAYLFVPLVAAVIVESAGWRWVTVVWIAPDSSR
jgi:MFS family permease